MELSTAGKQGLAWRLQYGFFIAQEAGALDTDKQFNRYHNLLTHPLHVW